MLPFASCHSPCGLCPADAGVLLRADEVVPAHVPVCLPENEDRALRENLNAARALDAARLVRRVDDARVGPPRMMEGLRPERAVVVERQRAAGGNGDLRLVAKGLPARSCRRAPRRPSPRPVRPPPQKQTPLPQTRPTHAPLNGQELSLSSASFRSSFLTKPFPARTFYQKPAARACICG